MDLSPFKLDIDELIKEFAEEELETLADMKRIWLSRKFSYIFEARPSTNLACFMQSLYSHAIGYLTVTNSLWQRLGALYCIYCLHETQPFKPPVKIYLSLGEVRALKALVVDAKGKGIRVCSLVVKRMLEKNMYLYGSVSMNEYTEKDRIKELVKVQNSYVQKMHEKLLANMDVERYLHMDLAMELDLNVLAKMSAEYEATKSRAIGDALEVVDIQNIQHIAEDRPTIGDEIKKIVDEWDNHMRTISQRKGRDQHNIVPQMEGGNSQQQQQLLSLPASEQQQDDDELQHMSFLELLMGDESPEQLPAQEDDSEFVKDLESQLFEDAP